MGLVTDIMATIDNGVKTAGEDFFNLTAGGMLPVMTICTTIMLILVGMNMAVGYYRMGARDSIQLATRICLIYIFAFSWSNFSVVYDAFTELGNKLAMAFFSVASNSAWSDMSSAMDAFSVDMADTADGVAKAQGSIMRGVLGAFLYAILTILIAIYVLIVAFAKIMIAFLIGVAPMAMVATIFDKFKGLFEAWLSSFMGYLMYPIAASAVMATIISVAQDQFQKQENVDNISQLLGFLVVVFVGIFALKHIPTAVTNITGQVHLANITPEALRLGQTSVQQMPGSNAIGNARETARGFMQGSGDKPEDIKEARSRELRERGARMRQTLRDRALLRRK